MKNRSKTSLRHLKALSIECQFVFSPPHFSHSDQHCQWFVNLNSGHVGSVSFLVFNFFFMYCAMTFFLITNTIFNIFLLLYRLCTFFCEHLEATDRRRSRQLQDICKCLCSNRREKTIKKVLRFSHETMKDDRFTGCELFTSDDDD